MKALMHVLLGFRHVHRSAAPQEINVLGVVYVGGGIPSTGGPSPS